MSNVKLPTHCPSCKNQLQVTHLHCANCATKVEGNFVLPSILDISIEDQELLIDYMKSNGSPQKIAEQYGLSYPTIRKKLNKLIEKLNQAVD